MIKHLSKRERLIALGTLAIFAIAGIDRFIVRPGMDAFTGSERSLQARRIEARKHMKLLVDESRVEARYKALVGALGTDWTPEAVAAELLEEIERLGQGSGVSIRDVKPLAGRSGEYYETFHLDLECEGSIEEIARFLFSVGESKLRIRIEKMRLAAKRGDEPTLTAALEVGTLRLLADRNL